MQGKIFHDKIRSVRVIVKDNAVGIFLEKIKEFPIWVKQGLLAGLSVNTNDNTVSSVSLYAPILTFSGHEEIKNRTCGFDLNIYNFLCYCEKNYNLLEISLNTYLSMEETTKYFVFCMEQGFVEHPENKSIEIMAGFICGKFRTGEYFLNRGIITKEQLDKAVEISLNSDKKFAQILIDMDLITGEDIAEMMQFKEDAKKRFILDYTQIPQGTNEFSSKEELYKQEISDLKSENNTLKKKLKMLSELVKTNDEADF